MRQTRIIPPLLLPTVAALLLVACGDDSSRAPSGSPTSASPASGKLGKIRTCKDFADTEPTANQELTLARGTSNDGVMGKLLNQTAATMWVGVRTTDTAAATTKWCTVAADTSVFFSRDDSRNFYLRNEEPEEGEPFWAYSTGIRVFDPDILYPGAKGVFNRSSGWAWEETFKEGESGTFNWGATKVEVKREKDETFDSEFKSKTYTRDGRTFSYLTSKMSDWAHFSVFVKGLQSPPP